MVMLWQRCPAAASRHLRPTRSRRVATALTVAALSALLQASASPTQRCGGAEEAACPRSVADGVPGVDAADAAADAEAEALAVELLQRHQVSRSSSDDASKERQEEVRQRSDERPPAPAPLPPFANRAPGAGSLASVGSAVPDLAEDEDEGHIDQPGNSSNGEIDHPGNSSNRKVTGDELWLHGCDDCMAGRPPDSDLKNEDDDEDGVKSKGIWHYAQDCFSACGGKTGYCNWCGPGNACCRGGWGWPQECANPTYWPAWGYHTCVQPRATPKPTPAPTPPPPNPALLVSSDAPVMEFYMYRAVSDKSYAPENVNAANLAGVIWYLHNEVVSQTPRKFSITRILRMKMRIRATQPLLDKGMHFGVRYAFDSGKCTGPWECEDQWPKYGYFVGCNKLGDFPFPDFETHYPNGIWYSLPGACPSDTYQHASAWCKEHQPGGLCSDPNGQGDCTYSYENAGEIKVDDLVGIWDYWDFVRRGFKEYNVWSDKGYGIHFWDRKNDRAANERRVQAARDLFKKWHGEEALQEPPCDFNKAAFYDGVYPHD